MPNMTQSVAKVVRRMTEPGRPASAGPPGLKGAAATLLKRVSTPPAEAPATRTDHIEFYRGVMDNRVAQGKGWAVGNSDRPAWARIGKTQFDYLVKHGLQPHHHILEIGCGNLRAGWRFINYLEAAHYYGFDISAEVLFSAQQTVVEHGLQAKMPYLTLVRDMRFAFFPDAAFDVVHAHSVFSHCPLPVIDECFAHVGRIMKPDGFFDFTFNRTDGEERQHRRESYWFRVETLTEAAQRHGFSARFMDDWEQNRHPQSKIRLTRR